MCWKYYYENSTILLILLIGNTKSFAKLKIYHNRENCRNHPSDLSMGEIVAEVGLVGGGPCSQYTSGQGEWHVGFGAQTDFGSHPAFLVTV